ncbi:hypothetical protein [Pelagibacterium sp. H642]|uniref:thermonuclease family protein n=1 Tax=Pelagibacterium sp. H642 TaxID=1881069 RepID=UPI002815FD47|nr:hypothetical protein [Pelagibacterium sp. H642]
MRAVFGKMRARASARRRRPPMIAEPALAFVAVVALGWVAIERGYVDLPALDLPAVAVAPAESISARFTLCSGAGGTCVIDGDTVRIDGQSVRIADIDTPEVQNYACPQEKALGDRATNACSPWSMMAPSRSPAGMGGMKTNMAASSAFSNATGSRWA